jgi:3-dehydroquinate synthetase/transketolase/predicted O-methyltransferase YrrM
MTFPIDLSKYVLPKIDPWNDKKALSTETREQIQANVELCRDAIVSFTACGMASGNGGHTGGAFDVVPEVCLLDAMFKTQPEKFVPVFFDEAGHRVATQYLMAAIRGFINPDDLKDYRAAHSNLPGHPELDTPGVEFASGRLGHMFPYVAGVAMANPSKVVICLGSDGSNMEGNNAEAARLCVAQNLNVKIIVDDNDVTIAGHPSQYLGGFSVAKTLAGHGMTVFEVNGEDVSDIYEKIHAAVLHDGPVAVCIHRDMAPGIHAELEGKPAAHEGISVARAVDYLEARNLPDCVAMIKAVPKTKEQYEYKGAGKLDSLRQAVADAMVVELAKMTAEERKARCIAIDSDVEGSTGFKAIKKDFPEMYVNSGIMERANFSACAGFGREDGKQGIFSTFCAFSEMLISEIFMARLNNANVLSHFSHTGVDEMADNTCHFGLNPFFCDNGLTEQGVTPLYFPGEKTQVDKLVEKVFWDKGLRFIFSLRSKVPQLLNEEGKPYYTEAYSFVSGKDEILLEGTDGYIVAFGDALYRANDAAQRLRLSGINVGLVNKPTLNVLDEETMAKVGKTGFVLVVEPLNKLTGLGVRYGSWLLKLGLAPAYDHLGACKLGCGGLWEQAYHQGYDSQSIQNAARELHAKAALRAGTATFQQQKQALQNEFQREFQAQFAPESRLSEKKEEKNVEVSKDGGKMTGSSTVGSGPNGEFKIDVKASTNFAYDYTFVDTSNPKGAFDANNSFLADRFREYGRCVVVCDARVYDIYGDAMRTYFQQQGMGLEVLPLGIDEEQKSLKTVEDVMVFFANVGLMRRETPLLMGGGLITDICGTACALYRRSTAYVRLPTTLIGMIDAAIAIKVGGNLAEKHKNRIGAFHPHSGVIIDFNLLKTLSEAHVRNGVAELIKISTVEHAECFALLEQHTEDLIKYKFGFAEGSPAGLREVGQTIAKKCVQKMLELECPNLLEHDQNRAIAYGHTWSPVYELTPKPVPLHHGHAISIDMAFSATWAAKEGWIPESLRDRIHAQFRRAGLSRHHECFTTEKLHYGTKTILERRDGDLYAAIPDGEIGRCRYVMVKDFKSRAEMDASLASALELHRSLMRLEGGGVGKEPFITDGFHRNRKASSKLELGTWAERLSEMVAEMGESQSFETVKGKVGQITRWWDLTAEYLEKNSTSLGDAVQKVLKATASENPFPEGMDMNWALDVQSAQTLNFIAGTKGGKVAWDLGTLTGVSAAVLSQHMKVTTVERESSLVNFARKHLPENVDVVQSEIEAFLQAKAVQGEKADFIFMDLDKPMYERCYTLIMENELLAPTGIMLCDNVLYRGLTAQHHAGEMPVVSKKTASNAAAMEAFLALVRADTKAGKVRSLMMPVRDGMLALQTQ